MKNKKLKRVLFVPDLHCPWEDKRAVILLLKVIKKFKPDICVQLGDVTDNYKASRFSKDPSRRETLKEELESGAAMIRKIDAALPRKCMKYFTTGNHDLPRIEKLVRDTAPELEDLLVNPVLETLKELRWKVVSYNETLRLGELNVSHQFGRSGPLAHIQTMREFGGCTVNGHNHAGGVAYGGTLNGRQVVSMSAGWLGDRRFIDYAHQARVAKDWILGCGIGYLRADGIAYLNFLPFLNYQTVVEGELVRI